MEKVQIERKLVGRLKIMGMILLLISVGFFIYSFFVEELEADQELLSEFDEPPPLNMLMVSGVLSIVGSACVAIAWKRKVT